MREWRFGKASNELEVTQLVGIKAEVWPGCAGVRVRDKGGLEGGRRRNVRQPGYAGAYVLYLSGHVFWVVRGPRVKNTGRGAIN